MRQRCSNPKCSAFKHYGARGISVCDKWSTFAPFFEDLGPRPSKRHSIGRIDNDGNYEPGNVRWETPEEQQSNTRSNRKITAFGQTLILSEWAKLKGLELSTLWVRLVRLKWDPERALSTPVHRKIELGKIVREAGYLSVSDFIKKSGMSGVSIYNFAKGGGIRPETASRLTKLLCVEIPPEQIKQFHFSGGSRTVSDRSDTSGRS